MGGWNLRKKTVLLLTVLALDGIAAGVATSLIGRFAEGEVEANIAVTTPQLPEPGGKSESESEPEDSTSAAEMTANQADEQKTAVLTFDDGPHPECTMQLLDGLRERGVKATFFLMGQSVEGNEEVVRTMQEDGHLIGNHCFQHIRMTKVSETEACEAVSRTSERIEEITGTRPRYLRPPYGEWNENLECLLDMTPVFWTLDSLDWKLQNADAIVRRVEKSVRDGDIILMHDIFPTSVEAALRLVDELGAQGYRFVTAEELLVD